MRAGRTFFAALACVACLDAPAISSTYQLVASGLDRPVDIQNAHDGSNRLFVIEELRGIRVIKGGALLSAPFLDLSTLVSLHTPEAGIIGLAFDPAYATNHRFFVSYVRASDGALRVESYTASATNPDVADAASMAEVITIPHPDSVFGYGGYIAFGPDGMLFVGTGDRSGSEAQDLASLWGKLLRLDVHGASGYAVPPDNYHVATGNPAARPEIVARGLNNPRRFSFDPVLGDLYIGDVDRNANEVDTMPNGYWRIADMNYGAPLCRGRYACPPGIATPQTVVNAYAITGGVVYRGSKSPALYGNYVYGGYGTAQIWAATHDGMAWYNGTLSPSPTGMENSGALGTDESGELYLATYSDGNIYAISGPGTPVPVSLYGRASGQHIDFDGDGKGDILWHAGPPMAPAFGAWFMNGTSVSSTATVPLPAAAGQWWPLVWDVGRFHGGARSDRLWRDFDASYWLDVNQASGTSTTQIRAGGGAWEVVEGGDFNGDGKRDLLWRKDNLYGIWLMDGATPLATGMIASPDPGYYFAAADPAVVGDFNGDGKSDVLWYRPGDGSAALSLMDGLATTWSGTVFTPAGRQWVPVRGADFNGDGKTDIVWTLSNGALGIWLMNGSAPSAYGVVIWGNPGRVFMWAADVDGDGKADLILEGVAGGADVWLMDGLAVRDKIHLDPGPDWYMVQTDDYDGDGKADILWQKSGTSEYAISTSIAPFALVPLPAPPAGWSPYR